MLFQLIWESFSSSKEESWSSDRVTIRLLVTSMTHHPQVGNWGWFQASSIRALCSLGPSKEQKCFRTLPRICASRQSCLGVLQKHSSSSCLVFALWPVPSTVGPYLALSLLCCCSLMESYWSSIHEIFIFDVLLVKREIFMSILLQWLHFVFFFFWK